MLILGGLSVIGAATALVLASRHAIHFEKCRKGRP
jgi:hypothetical protein